jgi:MFS family permease
MCKPAKPVVPNVGPLNQRALAAACFANMAHFYAICSIFSYAGYLAVDSGWAANSDSAGYVAGWLPTALLLGRLPTSVVWGQAADRFGRRPAVVCSMLAVALGNLCFGLTTDLYLALLARFLLLGALNGYSSLTGLVCHDLGGEKRQAEVFAYVISAGSIIAVVGPGVGGFTYGSLGARFPALAPSLIGCCLALVAVAATLAWLPETRPPRRAPRVAAPSTELQAATESAPSAAASPVQAPSATVSPAAAASAGGPVPAAPPSAAKEQERSLCRILLRAPMPLAILLRAGHGLLVFAVFDVVPLWAISSHAAGGLALSEQELGLLLAGAAIGQVVYTGVAMGKLANRLGMRQAFIYGSIVAGVTLAAVPCVPRMFYATDSAIDASKAAAIASTSVIYCLHTCAMLTAGTGAMGMSANLCAQHPQRSGALNGAVALSDGFGKMLGPALAAPLFAMAISKPESLEPVPAGLQALTGANAQSSVPLAFFCVLGGLFVALGAAAALLPTSVDGVDRSTSATSRTFRRLHEES